VLIGFSIARRPERHGSCQLLPWLTSNVDIAAYNQAEKACAVRSGEAADEKTASVVAADRDQAINACVCANRGKTVIVLICVDFGPPLPEQQPTVPTIH
jgi:hypothetical protein